MGTVTFAVCTYNRKQRLLPLIEALKNLQSPIHFEILFVDNNSNDGTAEVLSEHSGGSPSLRFVTERTPGIVPARNRAIEETLKRGSDYLVFIDDDEIPFPGMLSAAVHALVEEKAEAVGGRVKVRFPIERPKWLEDNLLGFLSEVNYGEEPFWITNGSTPVWTSNIAYRMDLFADGLRFDSRYNRQGYAVGGGEDVMMFEELLKRGIKMRYRPDMAVHHDVEEWRISRRYFIKLHYTSGWKSGMWEDSTYSREILGVPPFLVTQAFRHFMHAVPLLVGGRQGAMRQAMTAAHSFGMIGGRYSRWMDLRKREETL
ncbi:glycosyltransferase family 2 protein [Geobacter sp.]|uniref:glycosyltransferase family 2 protein n=1 Tax=Geobacter sp. TaxID=46610 RepID=UPI0027B95CE3|nr:glycosyltransferase family 2 protein [Geobacter sp.]